MCPPKPTVLTLRNPGLKEGCGCGKRAEMGTEKDKKGLCTRERSSGLVRWSGNGKTRCNLEGSAQRLLGGRGWGRPGPQALSPEFDRQVRESKASPFVQLHISLSKLILNQTKTWGPSNLHDFWNLGNSLHKNIRWEKRSSENKLWFIRSLLPPPKKYLLLNLRLLFW